MPDDAIERARLMDMRLRGHSMALLEYKRYDPAARNGMTNAEAVKYGEFLEEVRQLLLAFASQQAPEGWSKVATLEEAASECSRIGTDTVFASDVTEDFKAGYQAAVNTCCASLALIARHAVPAAMLDAAPSVTLGEVG